MMIAFAENSPSTREQELRGFDLIGRTYRLRDTVIADANTGGWSICNLVLIITRTRENILTRVSSPYWRASSCDFVVTALPRAHARVLFANSRRWRNELANPPLLVNQTTAIVLSAELKLLTRIYCANLYREVA